MCVCAAYSEARLKSFNLDALFHYEGECSSEEARAQIAENFIVAIKKSGFEPTVCPSDSTECYPKNVQVNIIYV